MTAGVGGDRRYRGTTRARRAERRRRPHRVKWKPVYARLSSRVNPDHSSIAPQTGDPRDLSSPSAGKGPIPSTPLRFLALWPGNQFQRHTFCAIEIDGVTRERERERRVPPSLSLSLLSSLFFLVPLDYRGSRMTREDIFVGEMDAEKGPSSKVRRVRTSRDHFSDSSGTRFTSPSAPPAFSLSLSLFRSFTTDDRQSIKA